VQRASASRDGRRIVTSSGDGTARVWDLAPSPATALPLLAYTPYAKFSPDGSRVLTMDRVWDAFTGERITPPWNAELIYPYMEGDFSSDGRLVVTNVFPAAARVRSAATGEPVTPLLQHAAPVHSARFSP